MHIAKFLASAAFLAAPFTIVSAQSATSQPDSGSNHQSGKWIAGTGAAAGAALFLAFTHSGNGGGNHSSAFVNPPQGPNPPSDPSAPPAAGPPTGGFTPPPAGTPPDTTTPPDTAVTPPPSNPSTPLDTTSATPPDTTGATPPAQQDNPPIVDGGNPGDPQDNPPAGPPNDSLPHEDAPPGTFQSTSTVPEPGSLALTATGIIGLVPLVRRRRR